MTVTATDIINIPVSNTALQWAAYTSLKKFPYTTQGIMHRPPLVILDNLFRGDLAKSALIEFLQSRGVTITQEYDRIRTDNFMNARPHEYDFIANQSKIEVNSSAIPARDTRLTALNNDIKVTAGNAGRIYNYPNNFDFDITVQLYFDINSANGINGTQYTKEQLIAISNELESPQDSVLNTIVSNLNAHNRYTNNLFGYGWATANEIEQFRINNRTMGQPLTWSYPGNSRTYWKCEIKDTNPFSILHTSV
jgi:hypothetical protein